MNVYLESSVIVRRVFRQPHALAEWGDWGHVFTSELTRIEALKVLFRLRLSGELDDEMVADKRAELEAVFDTADFLAVSPKVLARAAEPFPTTVGTLDSIHLATALLKENEIEGTLAFLTHDRQLGVAAYGLGFDVRGVANL